MGKYYLAHHGVKGMKWGVRHASAKKSKNNKQRSKTNVTVSQNDLDLARQKRIQETIETLSRAHQVFQYYGLKTEPFRNMIKGSRQIAKDAYKPIEKDPKYEDRGKTFIGSLLDAVIGNEQKKDV